MKRDRKKRCLIVLSVVLLVVLLIAGTAGVLYSRQRMGPLPLCNISLDFDRWMMEQHKGETNPPYPNAKGSSRVSLRQVTGYMLPEYADRLLQDYAYIPGLHVDDPQDLILLYVKERTRYTWHGDPKAVCRKPAWLVFSPGFDSPIDTPEWCPESGRRLSDDEFFTRLQKTLGFLKENERPHWENILKEHSPILGLTNE